jgi:hypothetical protein
MNQFDALVAKLEADWPEWHVWIVHRVVGGPLWCAHRRDDQRQVLNAGSADELAEYLEGEASL